MDHEVKRYVIEEAFLVFQLATAVIIGLLLPKATVQSTLFWALVLIALVIALPFAKYLVEKSIHVDRTTRERQLQQERDDLAAQLQRETDGSNTALVHKRIEDELMDALSDLLRDCVRELKEQNEQREVTASFPEAIMPLLDELRGRRSRFLTNTVRRALDSICSALNHRDNARDDERDIRATFFRLNHGVGDEVLMNQYAYHYPAAISPETRSFSSVRHAQAAIFHCYRAQNMRVVPNVQEAFNKGEEWVEMRPGQHTQYGSMVCYPVITGVPHSQDCRFIGVITLTSRLTGLFSNDVNASPFPEFALTKWLHPFAIFIGILMEMERRDEWEEQTLKEVLQPLYLESHSTRETQA